MLTDALHTRGDTMEMEGSSAPMSIGTEIEPAAVTIVTDTLERELGIVHTSWMWGCGRQR